MKYLMKIDELLKSTYISASLNKVFTESFSV